MSSIYVSQLNIYPVKSLRGLSLEQMQVEEKGAQNDRRFMVIDENGRYLTQRQHPEMTLISADLGDNQLTLTTKGKNDLVVNRPGEGGSKSTVQVWDDEVEAIDVGEAAAQWLSQFLDRPARLVFMPDSSHRYVDKCYAVHNEVVSFADGFPFLLISEASLADLNSRLPLSLGMNRFRPNIVVSGCQAFAEDEWPLIRIGGLDFQVAKPCSRCVIPSIDPLTAEKESLISRTLATFRRKEDRKVYFGQNLIHQGKGVIKVGDEVEILSC